MNARRWLITAVLCLLIVAGLAGYKFLQIRAAIAKAKSFPEPSASVQAVSVQASAAERHIETIGEVLAPEAVELRNELEGRVSAVAMVAGSRVKKGDVLLRMDVSEESARLAGARASAELARLNLERMRNLITKKAISQDRLDQAEAELDVAKARVSELQALIDKKTLRAPFDAAVGLHEIEAGEYLNANTALVWLVGTQNESWVDFSLPLAQGSVAIGDTVRVLPQGRTDQVREAVVIAVNPAVSPESRNRRYRARMKADPLLPPNSVANVSVQSGTQQQFQLPAQAILRDAMGTYVFVLDKAENSILRARRQSVTLGSVGEAAIAVLEGLQPGQTVATHGAFKLRNGMRAEIRERIAERDGADDTE
jgi:membrane fusion protein, multidrug efflux system